MRPNFIVVYAIHNVRLKLGLLHDLCGLSGLSGLSLCSSTETKLLETQEGLVRVERGFTR